MTQLIIFILILVLLFGVAAVDAYYDHPIARWIREHDPFQNQEPGLRTAVVVVIATAIIVSAFSYLFDIQPE